MASSLTYSCVISSLKMNESFSRKWRVSSFPEW